MDTPTHTNKNLVQLAAMFNAGIMNTCPACHGTVKVPGCRYAALTIAEGDLKVVCCGVVHLDGKIDKRFMKYVKKFEKFD